MNFIENFFMLDSQVTIEMKKLFKKKFWKKKKRIKKFFNDINILLKEEYDFYTKKEWNGLVHKIRLFLEKKKIEDLSTRILLFRKLRVFEQTCYENSYPELVSEYFCQNIKINKTIICKKCRGERFMYLNHSEEGKNTCKRCNEKIKIFYEKCC